MLVSELMSRAVVTIGIDDHCQEAARRMVTHKVRHLPVLGPDGTPRGIVTDRDLRHQLFGPDAFGRIGSVSVEDLLRARPVKQVMSSPVICVSTVAELEEAAALMRRHKIGALPVLEAGRVVGVLTETDLLRQIVRADERAGDAVDVIVSYP